MENETEKNCFVPNCINKKTLNGRGRQLQFFKVPDGIEGLFWTKAVKIRQRNYEKLIDLLSSSDSTLGLEKPLEKPQKPSKKKPKSPPIEYKYCCEVHFDIDADIDRVFSENGSVEYKVKPGAVPSVKPQQSKWLCDVDGFPEEEEEEEDIEMKNEIIKTEETMADVIIESNNLEESVYDVPIKNYVTIIGEQKNDNPIRNYVSIVDISTLTYQRPKFATPNQICYEVDNLNGLPYQETEISNEPIIPMLPLTVALMKRKSLYYMGIQPKRFLRLLQLAIQRTQLSEVKIMITLRKIRLNEEFEALGDLFDMDKTTAEQFFHQSKHEVINLVDLLATTTEIEMSSVPIIKVEQQHSLNVPDPMLTILTEQSKFYNNYDHGSEAQMIEHKEDRPSSPESSATYIGSEDDPDVLLEDLDSATSSSCYSDDSNRSDYERTDECDICKKKYSARGLEKHMERTHLNHQNLNRTYCGLCLEKFNTNLLLKAHQKDTHGGAAFDCDLCRVMFASKRSINLHILMKHAKVKKYLCDVCGEGFPYPGTLRYHIKTKHMKVRKHECHLCDMKYFEKNSLRSHICAVHTNERPFKCKAEGCSKTFNRASTFKSHKRVHATDKYVCKICSKEFSFKNNLRTHLRNIHGQMQ